MEEQSRDAPGYRHQGAMAPQSRIFQARHLRADAQPALALPNDAAACHRFQQAKPLEYRLAIRLLLNRRRGTLNRLCRQPAGHLIGIFQLHMRIIVVGWLEASFGRHGSFPSRKNIGLLACTVTVN